MVKDRRIPGHVTCENDMWERVPFVIRVGSHREVGQPALDVQRDDVAIIGLDALKSAGNLYGLVIDIVEEVLDERIE